MFDDSNVGESGRAGFDQEFGERTLYVWFAQAIQD
jgi:hypothetical protein